MLMSEASEPCVIEATIARHRVAEESLYPPGHAPLCREAAALARRLRKEHGQVGMADLAAAHGVRISEDCWQVAGGRMLALAECSPRPPEIRLNREALAQLAARLAARRGIDQSLDHWLSERSLTELAIAHELWHLLSRQSPGPAVESAAHAFARELTGMPFSPRLCESLLRLAPMREAREQKQ